MTDIIQEINNLDLKQRSTSIELDAHKTNIKWWADERYSKLTIEFLDISDDKAKLILDALKPFLF